MSEPEKTVYPEQSSVESEMEFKLNEIHDRIMQFGIIHIVLLIIILVAVLLSGCAALEHTDKDGNVTRYLRIGPQSIGDGTVTLPDGTVLNFAEQKSEMPPIKITLPNGIIIESGKEVKR